MAGYIGSKAVSLSTTAADVTGDAEIGGDLTVDTNTLHVDSTNNRVGVGTASPARQLTVEDSGNAIVSIKSGTASSSFLLMGDTASDNIGMLKYNNADDSLGFYAGSNSTERMRIDSSGNVGIGTSSPAHSLSLEQSNKLGWVSTVGSDKAAIEFSGTDDSLRFYNNSGSTERMRIDASGNVLVGKTSADNGATVGVELRGDVSKLYVTDSASSPLIANRLASDGNIAVFQKDGTTVGVIHSQAGVRFGLGNLATGLLFNGSNVSIHPWNTTTNQSRDNSIDFGNSSNRWDDIYATNGTIQTSDRNEKQQIASLTDAEMQAAKAISALFKTFKWNDSVAEKGDAARTHAGVIAQDVEQAMTDAGLNAGDYAFFISTTWWETQTEVPAVEAVEAQDAVYEDVIIPAVEEVLDEEGNVVTEAQPERTEQRLVTEAVEAVEAQEAYTRTDTYDTLEEAPEGATERNRKGIRYPELLSFIGAATEQRLASIETRLDALEAN